MRPAKQAACASVAGAPRHRAAAAAESDAAMSPAWSRAATATAVAGGASSTGARPRRRSSVESLPPVAPLTSPRDGAIAVAGADAGHGAAGAAAATSGNGCSADDDGRPLSRDSTPGEVRDLTRRTAVRHPLHPGDDAPAPPPATAPSFRRSHSGPGALGDSSGAGGASSEGVVGATGSSPPTPPTPRRLPPIVGSPRPSGTPRAGAAPRAAECPCGRPTCTGDAAKCVTELMQALALKDQELKLGQCRLAKQQQRAALLAHHAGVVGAGLRAPLASMVARDAAAERAAATGAASGGSPIKRSRRGGRGGKWS